MKLIHQKCLLVVNSTKQHGMGTKLIDEFQKKKIVNLKKGKRETRAKERERKRKRDRERERKRKRERKK